MGGRIFIGIDPGIHGGLAAITDEDVLLSKTDLTEADIWGWFIQFIGVECYAVIEQQTPRPTFIPKMGISTILASTCVLFGSYMQLRTMLVCAAIPYEICPPKRWESTLGIQSREEGEKDNHWKNRLKQKAQQLYPTLTVTLWNADALLIADYARRRYNGEVGRAEGTAGSSAE